HGAPSDAAHDAGSRRQQLSRTLEIVARSRIGGPRMSTPQEGKQPPAIALPDQNGDMVELSSLKGRRVLVYFYPKADTPGCTTQACGLRDIAGQIGDTKVIGISPDKSPRLKKFDDK